MTHRATDAGTGVPRIWLLPLTLIAGLVFVTAAGVLSRSIIIDFLAWWPVWLLLLTSVVLVRGRRFQRVRLSGIVPVFATAALLVFTAGHIVGWAAMPSASQQLVGPEAVPGTSAALSARAGGKIVVTSDAIFLYEVDPIRRGGDVGVPSATEQTQGTSISVVLAEPDDPGFYVFEGWELAISPEPTWNLTLEADLEADLSSLDLTGLQLFGSGLVVLGQPNSVVPATVSGVFEVSVPSAAAVRVIGEAQVPPGWEQTNDGFLSPVNGDGWVISAPEGSSVTITTR